MAVVFDRTRVSLSAGQHMLAAWDRDSRLKKPAAKRAARVIFPEPLYGVWGEPPLPDATAVPSLFRTSEAVKAAVEEFANKVATVPLHLYKQIDTEGRREEIKSHPGLSVLRNPNPILSSRWMLFWHTVADLKLSGNAYWFLAGPQRGAPQEIWRCNPRFTRIIRSKTDYIAGYVTEIDGLLIPLDRDEVIHFKRPNVISDDDLYGMSDLAAAARAAQTGSDMANWNRKMFARDYAVPAGMVVIDGNIADADYERVKAEWRTAYGGGKRRTAFLRGGKMQFQQIGLSQTDVDFLAGSKWEAEKVYRVFGTYHLLPAQFADDRKVNERLFLEGHAWPQMTYLAEIISDRFFGFWGPSDGIGALTAEFEDIRPRERALDLAEEQEESQGMKFNEWREKRGMEPVDGGDDILFIHVVKNGEKLKFERDAMPEPEPPLQLMAPAAAPPSDKKPESDAKQPEDDQEKAERRENAGNEVGDEPGEFSNKAAIHTELGQWQKYVTKRLGTEHRPFKSSVIPRWLAERVQTSLGSCTDVVGVKTVFDQAHELADGSLSVKSSYGVPDGTVVLYLSGIEDVLLVQQALQRCVPSDAPFRWTPCHQLHITLVHCPLVDEPDYRDMAQSVGPFTALVVRGMAITTFETEGGAVPIVALVEPSDELCALQADVWAEFAARGIAVSVYSQPDNWKPHITLGYVEAAYHQTMPAIDTAYGDFGCTADVIAFTRGDFENLFVRAATPLLVDLPAVGDELVAEKAIQATRLEFETDFERVLSAGRAGDLDRRAWANRTRTLLRKYGEKAYRDGLSDGGVQYGADEPLDPDDRAELNGMLATQNQHVTELGRVLFRTERGVTDGQAAIKPELWFNKSIMPLYQAGQLSANRNGLHLWERNPLKKSCETCRAADGQIHRLRHWHSRNIKPQGDNLLCSGFRCGCILKKTEGRAVGRLDAIPTQGLKTLEETEGEPMVAQWPENLPEEIVKECARVLGKRIVAVSTDVGDMTIDSTRNHFVMTLREDAGYYRELSEEAAQKGLSLIDPRLKLVSIEPQGETDLRLVFAMEDA